LQIPLTAVAAFCRGISGEAAAAAAAERQVDVIPVSRYSHRDASPQGLQLGFAALENREIRRGVRELAIGLESLSRLGPHGRKA
jgi:GntR family transcriptional regulator / MocR family aminotransferase